MYILLTLSCKIFGKKKKELDIQRVNRFNISLGVNISDFLVLIVKQLVAELENRGGRHSF
jgi:hypothetical protein